MSPNEFDQEIALSFKLLLCLLGMLTVFLCDASLRPVWLDATDLALIAFVPASAAWFGRKLHAPNVFFVYGSLAAIILIMEYSSLTRFRVRAYRMDVVALTFKMTTSAVFLGFAARGSAMLLRRGPRYPKGACKECGYDLRGIVSGRCSECGTRVNQSMDDAQ